MNESRSRSRRRPAAEWTGERIKAKKAVASSQTAFPSPSIRRALVVDVDPATVRLCREALMRSGFAIEVVDSGIAAVVAAREGVPDIIVMDLQLRDVPGREAIEWLRSNPALRSTPIIVLTASGEADVEAVALQPDACLRKPVSLATMQRVIREILE